ncbi:MAG: glycosyltransferase family 2 protein [Candidatus Omnitrophota bacterium]
MNCDIIMPVWNSLKVTKECIESIRSNTSYPYRLIVIDNASDSPVREYLDTLNAEDEISLIRNKTNRGFVKAVNQGLRASEAPFVCIMNNDTLATNGWLTEMVEVARLRSDIGIVNPSSNNLGQDKGHETLDACGARLKRFKGQYVEMGACVGFCMLIKREVLEAAGDFDEVYEMGNFEETDFCRKAERQGYICVRAKGAYVYHHINASFVKVKNYETSFKKNQEIFYKRWGRTKRDLYILTKRDDRLSGWVAEEAMKKARGGNWVWFFFKDTDDLPNMREHSNIKLVRVPRAFFDWNCVVRILKKKKRFDSIYSDDPALVNRIKRYGGIHKAETALMGG